MKYSSLIQFYMTFDVIIKNIKANLILVCKTHIIKTFKLDSCQNKIVYINIVRH